MTEWYVEVIIHAKVSAEKHTDALDLVCQYVRDGIGPEPVEPLERQWGTAIAAVAMWDPATPGESYVAINEEYERRHEQEGRP